MLLKLIMAELNCLRSGNMATVSAFSSSDTEVLSRGNDIESKEQILTPVDKIDEIYETQRCIDFIQEQGCGKVALQFPDYLLCDSIAVTRRLQEQTSAKVFLLADTSYGSYDVDEVASKHVQADLIIHYGKSALTASATTKTLFVFGRNELDEDELCASFYETFPNHDERLLLLLQLAWSWAKESLQKVLQSRYRNLSIAHVETPRQPKLDAKMQDLGLCSNTCSECTACQSRKEVDEDSSDDISSMQRLSTDQQNIDIKRTPSIKFYRTGCYEIPLDKDVQLEDYTLFFVGNIDSESLRNLLLIHPKVNGYVFDPTTSICSSITLPVSKLLMKRYYVVEKVKDAKTVGILVGTMGMAGYTSIIEHLKKILSQSGKKSYTFVVGKLNPQKLANFPEVDIFVLVACPEESLVDCSEYYRTICTPYEVELACNANRQWEGKVPLDFRQLLPGGSHFVDFKPHDDSDGDVSLVTGKVRSFNVTSAPSTDIEKRSKNSALEIFHPHAAAQHYSDRSWKGLEQKLGKTLVSSAKEGRRGVPMTYTHENQL